MAVKERIDIMRKVLHEIENDVSELESDLRLRNEEIECMDAPRIMGTEYKTSFGSIYIYNETGNLLLQNMIDSFTNHFKYDRRSVQIYI